MNWKSYSVEVNYREVPLSENFTCLSSTIRLRFCNFVESRVSRCSRVSLPSRRESISRLDVTLCTKQNAISADNRDYNLSIQMRPMFPEMIDRKLQIVLGILSGADWDRKVSAKCYECINCVKVD